VSIYIWKISQIVEQSFLLTNDPATSLDFTQYHKCYYQVTHSPVGPTVNQCEGASRDILNNPEHEDTLDSAPNSPILTLSIGRPCGSKNKPGTWKDTAAPAWKPPAHIQTEL
jgi:hypothetical protein